MANTYSQIYIQIVFAVKHRENLICKTKRTILHRVIDRIIKNRGQKMLAVFAMPDHVHILVSIGPDIALSNLVRDIKCQTSQLMNQLSAPNIKFRWQRGFGSFSYSKSAINNVYNYIQNQEEIHRKRTFKKEYLSLLKKREVTHDPKYLFEWYN